jgi:hypothetical protein
MNPEIMKIVNSFDPQKRELFFQNIAECDEINNWPESGLRHSNHTQSEQMRIMNVQQVASTLPAGVGKLYIDTLIAAGVLKKPETNKGKQNGAKKQ